MSRPKKHKIESDSLPPYSISSISDLRERAEAAHADPYRECLQFKELESLPLKLVNGLNLYDDYQEDLAFSILEKILEASPEEFKRISALILRMKENLQGPPSRQSYILTACADFIELKGRVPAKSELKEFILDYPQIYKDAPAKEDKKGWSRLLKEVELHRLDDRPGVPPKKGRLPEYYRQGYQDKEGNHYMRDVDKFGEPTGPYIEVDWLGNPTGREIPADEWE